MTDGPQEQPAPRGRTITGWVVASILAFIFQSRLSGLGVFTGDLFGWLPEDSPVHVSLLDSLAAGNPLALAVTPFLQGTFMPAFLSIVGVLFVGRLVERLRGGGFAFVVLVVGTSLGAAASWGIEGTPGLGGTNAFFALVGAAGALVARGEIERTILWSVSFPLLVLAGLFALFDGEIVGVSNVAHLAAATFGAVLAASLPRRAVIPRALRGGLGLWLLGGLLIVVPPAWQDGGSRWGGAERQALFGMEARFDTYDDPGGRFRLEHPYMMRPDVEPAPAAGGGRGEVLYLVDREGGMDWGFTLEIRPHRNGQRRSQVLAGVIDELRQEVGPGRRRGEYHVGRTIEVMAGEVPASLKVFQTGPAIGPGLRVSEIRVLVAVTREREYVALARYHNGPEGVTMPEREWALRTIGSLEIRE